VGELAGRRIEALDAVAGGHIEAAARRVERERLREPVAVAGEDAAGRAVELEERVRARRPQAALPVLHEVEHRLVELGPG